ncbi:aminoglycoside phosphotransferase [Nonomuraea sp. NPDC051191]|uniref:aminoglycoside phosphotransferase n=1 Tax=Nonomuraea sp. NPDC051191 TaxID=3364372 RepID=UPI00378A7FF0
MTSEHHESSGQRAFLRRVLREGATGLGVTLTGDVVFGWRDRTIGSAVTSSGGRFWLRATAEHHDWTQSEAWTGNLDAADIQGLPKPEVLARMEWDEPPVGIYAELMTYVPDKPCSATSELLQPFAAPDTWWADLRAALDRLAAHPTNRGEHAPDTVVGRLEDLYARRLDLPSPTLRTEHTDLHWANLTSPRLWILDWEYWGAAPAGYGAALLYCHTLLVPEAAEKVHEVFADLLDTPTGLVAQLSAAAHILSRGYRVDDYGELQRPVRAHAHRLLDEAERR